MLKMMRDFLKTIEQGVFLFDGGIGTQLQAHGLKVGESPEKWNLERPQVVEQIHANYVAAGARAVTTNTFGGSPHKLKSEGLADKVVELNRAAAQLARKAAGNRVFVAGSVGPTGALIMMGELSPEEMRRGFEQQVRGLIEGGADVIIIETMSDLDEAKLALEAAKNVSDLPVIVSMTYEPGARGFRTMMGVDIATAVQVLEEAGADVLGTNCGTGIDKAIEIVAEMRQHTTRPILAEPNAGLPKLVDGRTVYEETPERMAGKLPELIKAGANIVGGCCGTTPEHIKLFSKIISEKFGN